MGKALGLASGAGVTSVTGARASLAVIGAGPLAVAIGHSYGGMFGLWLALDAPDRVRSVISIGTPSVAFGAQPDALFKLLAFPGAGRLMLALPSPLLVYRRLLARSLGRPALEAAPPELVRATYQGTGAPGMAGRSPAVCGSSSAVRAPRRAVTSWPMTSSPGSGSRCWSSGAGMTPGTSRSARGGARPE